MDNNEKNVKINIKSIGNKSKKVSIIVIIIFVVFSFLYNSLYTIESGEVGILSTAGKYDMEEKNPGLHFKIPILQKVYSFNVRMQTVNYHSNRAKDSEGIINKPPIKVMDSKSLPIVIELTVSFTPQKDQAAEIRTKYGVSYFEKAINPVIRDIVRDVIGKYRAENIPVKRMEIAVIIKDKLHGKFKSLPFILNEVSLRKIILPQDIVKKIKEVQLAKQEEEKLAIIEKQAEKKQKIKTIEANTRMIEVTTKAKADAEKKRIEADAKAYQIAKESEAQADANKKIANSITNDLIKYEYIKKWSGKLPSTYLGGEKDGLMLNLDKK